MDFLIEKISPLIWHHSTIFAKVTLSKFSFIVDHTNQTIIIKEENGSNFPSEPILVTDVKVKNTFAGGVIESGFTMDSLLLRLEQLNYIGFSASLSSGGGISEAPIDGSIYGRKDASWVLIPTAGAGSGLNILNRPFIGSQTFPLTAGKTAQVVLLNGMALYLANNDFTTISGSLTILTTNYDALITGDKLIIFEQ